MYCGRLCMAVVCSEIILPITKSKSTEGNVKLKKKLGHIPHRRYGTLPFFFLELSAQLKID